MTQSAQVHKSILRHKLSVAQCPFYCVRAKQEVSYSSQIARREATRCHLERALLTTE